MTKLEMRSDERVNRNPCADMIVWKPFQLLRMESFLINFFSSEDLLRLYLFIGDILVLNISFECILLGIIKSWQLCFRRKLTFPENNCLEHVYGQYCKYDLDFCNTSWSRTIDDKAFGEDN